MAVGGSKSMNNPTARQTGSHGEQYQLNYILFLFLIAALYILLHATITGITYTTELWRLYIFLTQIYCPQKSCFMICTKHELSIPHLFLCHTPLCTSS